MRAISPSGLAAVRAPARICLWLFEVIARDEGTVSARENVPGYDGHGAPDAFRGADLPSRVWTNGANLPRKI